MLLVVLQHGVGKNFVCGPFASVTGRRPALPPRRPADACPGNHCLDNHCLSNHCPGKYAALQHGARAAASSRVVMLREVLREVLREGLRGGSHLVVIADWDSRARCQLVVTVVMVFNR